MNKFLFSLLIIAGFASCKTEVATCTAKARNTVVSIAEKDSVQRYLTANSITATRDTSGVFYAITTPGAGNVTADVCSFVTTRYNGKSFSGVHIDSSVGTSTFTSQLSGLIEGWEKGIPKVKTGGSITLYIPPSLAYGAAGVRDANNNVVIAPNTYMRFKIDVINIQ